MKKIVLTLLTAFFTLTATAQTAGDKFTVKRTNGTSMEYSMTEYDRITYSDNKQYIHKVGNETKIGTSIDNFESITFSIYHATDVSDVVLADNTATDEAKRLYKYLKLNYGVKTISSVIANVNWNHDEADKIYTATGKYRNLTLFTLMYRRQKTIS